MNCRRCEHLMPLYVEGDLKSGLADQVAEFVASLVTALPMTQNPDEIRRRLIAAGLGHRLTPTSFLAIKGAGIVGSVFLGIVLASSGLLPVGNRYAANDYALFRCVEAYVGICGDASILAAPHVSRRLVHL